MSVAYKISDSARTRPNTKQIAENIQYVESTSNDEETTPILKKSPVLLEGESMAENCFVEIIQSEDIVPDEDVEMGENGQYSIINVDPNITSCSEQSHSGMYLHKEDTLIKPGDKFDSHESFRLYIDGNADRWKYYYSCADSRAQSSGKEFYTYRCVYSKPKCDYKPKGLRKRAESLKTNCPCKIVLKRLSYNSKYLTAVFVCDHHNHELSQEAFLKLQHGRRLPPKLKEEITGLLYLDVDPQIIGRYVHAVTGLVLRKAYFNHVARTMKATDLEKTFTVDKLNLLYRKADELRRLYGHSPSDDVHVDLNVKGKRGAKKRSLEHHEPEPELENEVIQYEVAQEEEAGIIEYEEDDSSNKKSRLETCLQRLSYDDEVLQSVKRLQSSVQVEAQDSPWIKQEHFIAANGSFKLEPNKDQEVAEIAELVQGENIVVMEAIGEGGEGAENAQHYILENDLQSGEFTAYPCDVLYENEQPVAEVQEIVGNEEPEQFIEQEQQFVQPPSPVPSPVPYSVRRPSYTSVPCPPNDNYDQPINIPITHTSPDYEYIHRFNIDQYMIQPWFSKYIERAAEDSRASIAEMLSDVYLGKAMFRLVVSKQNAAKTIRISYLAENVPTLEVIYDRRKHEYRYQATKYCKKVMSLKKKLADTSRIVRHLNDVVLKLQKENRELANKNKTLDHNTRNSVVRRATESVAVQVEPAEGNEILQSDIDELQTKKESLTTEISDAQNHVAHLEEIKANLKRDICKFVSKKVLLKRISGEKVDKLEEVKTTLAKAIMRSTSDAASTSEMR